MLWRDEEWGLRMAATSLNPEAILYGQLRPGPQVRAAVHRNEMVGRSSGGLATKITFWTLLPVTDYWDAQIRKVLHREDGPALCVEADGEIIHQRAHYGERGAVLDARGQMRPMPNALVEIERAVRLIWPEAVARREEFPPLALAVSGKGESILILCELGSRPEWIEALRKVIEQVRPYQLAYAAPALYWEQRGERMTIADGLVLVSFNSRGRERVLRIELAGDGRTLAENAVEVDASVEDPDFQAIEQAMRALGWA